MKFNKIVLLFSTAGTTSLAAYIPKNVDSPGYPITESPEAPSAFPLTCMGSKGTSDIGDAVALGMLFTHPPGIAGPLFAEFLLQHGSEFVSQLSSISSEAMTCTGDQYTTGFKDLYINNIMSLASAAPVYSCFLSSLWSSAMATNTQVTATAFPPDLTPEQELKLRILFERHMDGETPFNYAGLLMEETEELISQVSSILKDARTNINFVTGYKTLYASFLLSYAYGETTQGGIGGFFKRENGTGWPMTPTVCGPGCTVRTPAPSGPIVLVPATTTTAHY